MEFFNEILADPRVEAFPVQPWFKIGIPALNAIVHKATAEGFSHIWFVSTRLVINEAIATKLLEEFSGNDLVVGAVMPGHRFLKGINICNGETCPYNTCAI